MSTTWSLALYLDALVTNLKARPGMAGVQVWSAPIPGDELELEALAFIDVLTDEDSAALGDNSREENYRIEGVIEVNKPGMGDDVAKAARDRATAILAEVETEVRNNVTQGLGQLVVRFSEITSINLRQRIRENYRRAVVEFDISVHHRK